MQTYRSRMHLVCSLWLFLTLLHLSNSLLLGAFNIKSFGDTKASDATLMKIITKIVKRYDVILIQEVRDSDLSATQTLMDYVNEDSPQYKYIVSEPLGANKYKERYLFLYREALVSVAKSYTYDDVQHNFSRKPFVVMFSSKNTAVKDFTLIPQHTCPGSAVKELNALYDVVLDVRTRWNTNDIVLLGDFNAGCSYVSGSDWQQIRIFTDKTFHWLITDAAVTTVSQTVCPYDRIVVTTDMMRGVVQNSAEVYNYMTDLNLIQKLALAVSDHFPVEVKLS
ncbi:deoxyribonuclease-1-like [Oreochromis niloticus]|uniref:Deoxyribonuclease n=1 Tax=Oreochromis niloticus TaxID=8128 RepID=I3JHA3_ORENI|nr:deoxyribonuclease-1-like [Oreochromis niloticus]